MLKSAIALIWYRVLWLKWELSLVTLDRRSRTDLWQAGELQVRTSRWIDAVLLNMFSFTALVTSTFIIVTCIYKNNPKGKGSLSAVSTDQHQRSQFWPFCMAEIEVHSPQTVWWHSSAIFPSAFHNRAGLLWEAECFEYNPPISESACLPISDLTAWPTTDITSNLF